MYSSPKRSILFSGILHAGAIALALALTHVPAGVIKRFVPSVLLAPDIESYKAARTAGGGGGGARSPTEAGKGRLPKPARRQFTPPMAAVENPEPKLMIEPAIVVDPDIALPRIDLANYGIPNGVPGLLSGGKGAGGGIGDGDGTGVGPGRGPGFGQGQGGGASGITGSGTGRGSITQPVLLSKIEPEYTEEARRAKVQGLVVLSIVVDERGRARDISLRQSLGLGLDERAAEAVSRWRFRPGTLDGRPAAMMAIIEVRFRLL